MSSTRGREIVERLPDSGFAKLYYAVVAHSTDAPDEFIVWTALACLGAVVGPNVAMPWAARGYLRGNLWVCLVADSTVSRKSSCLRVVEDALLAVDGKLLGAHCTPEAYPDEFSEHPTRLFVYDEVTGLLSQLASKGYMEGVKEALTSLYAGTTMRVRTKTAGRREVSGAYLSLLGSTNVEWLQSRINEGDLRGGFLARWVVVRGTSTRYYPFPPAMPEDGWQVIVRCLQRIRSNYSLTKHAVSLGPDARDFYAGWREGMERAPGLGPEMKAVSGRLADTALKLALLLTVDRAAKATLVEREDLETACLLAEAARDDWRGLVEGGLATDKHAVRCQKVLDLVRAAGTEGLRNRDLLRRLSIETAELARVEATLVGAERIVVSMVGRAKVWRLSEGSSETVRQKSDTPTVDRKPAKSDSSVSREVSEGRSDTSAPKPPPPQRDRWDVPDGDEPPLRPWRGA